MPDKKISELVNLTSLATDDEFVVVDKGANATKRTTYGNLSSVIRGDIVDGDMPAGSILQVVSTAKTSAFSSTSTSFTDVTGLTVSITPSSASNKILVLAFVNGNGDATNTPGIFRLNGGNASSFVGDAAGNRGRVTTVLDAVSARATSGTIIFLDSPNTTSSVTYAVQGRTNGAGTFYVNRSPSDTDTSVRFRHASSIVALEIAG